MCNKIGTFGYLLYEGKDMIFNKEKGKINVLTMYIHYGTLVEVVVRCE